MDCYIVDFFSYIVKSMRLISKPVQLQYLEKLHKTTVSFLTWCMEKVNVYLFGMIVFLYVVMFSLQYAGQLLLLRCCRYHDIILP